MKSEALFLLAALSSTVTCIHNNPPRLAGKPTKLSPEEFPWSNPFAPAPASASGEIESFRPSCEARRTFKASEYLLDDLSLPPPRGLQPYGDALKQTLRSKPYPGSWDGVDPHGYDRNLVQMEYADVPRRVRAWIEQQEVRATADGGLFSVFERKARGEKAGGTARPPETPRGPGEDDPADRDKVLLFAPGAIYRALPLWVAEGSDCEDALSDLSKYSASPSDGAVVAWTTEHTKAKRDTGRNIEFTIVAQILKKDKDTATESMAESSRDEL